MQERPREISYRDLFQIVGNSKILVLALTLAGVLTGLVLAYIWPPVYRAETLLAPAAQENGTGSTLSRLAGQFAPLSGLLGNSASEGSDSREVRIATLSSRRLTEAFIRERNLLPLLFPKRWDATARQWRQVDGRPNMPTMDEAFQLFDDKIRAVSEDRRTGLITLSVEWRDPGVAASWCNDLVARANDFLRRRAIDEAQRSIAFLENELKKTGVVERQQIIYRLIESKTSEIMMANARPEYAFAIVDPAVVSDRDNFVRPRRPAVILVATLLGLIAGLVAATIRWMRAGLGSDHVAQ